MTEMRDVDHTHPHDDEAFGEAFRRGPDVAADGGERDASTVDAEAGDETDSPTTREGPEATRSAVAEDAAPAEGTMTDVAHTKTDVDQSPTDGVDRTFERGTEGRSDSV